MKDITAATIEHSLSERFSAPAYAFLVQVRNGTGFQRTVRTADAIAFGLYPSRGLTITGFEIKVTKSDWKRELADPDKAEDIARFCHTWNIVAPEGVVPVDEVPTNWGLIELGSTGKLRSAKAAVPQTPEPLTPLMIASIMRNISTGMIPVSSIDQRIETAFESGRQHAEREAEGKLRAYEELKQSVSTFEKEAGIRIRRYEAGEIGQAVRTVLYRRTDPQAYIQQIETMREGLHRLDDELRNAMEQIAPTPAGIEVQS